MYKCVYSIICIVLITTVAISDTISGSGKNKHFLGMSIGYVNSSGKDLILSPLRHSGSNIVIPTNLYYRYTGPKNIHRLDYQQGVPENRSSAGNYTENQQSMIGYSYHRYVFNAQNRFPVYVGIMLNRVNGVRWSERPDSWGVRIFYSREYIIGLSGSLMTVYYISDVSRLEFQAAAAFVGLVLRPDYTGISSGHSKWWELPFHKRMKYAELATLDRYRHFRLQTAYTRKIYKHLDLGIGYEMYYYRVSFPREVQFLANYFQLLFIGTL